MGGDEDCSWECGDTVEFWFSERNLAAAKQFLRNCALLHG
jgi:transposase-like protein